MTLRTTLFQGASEDDIVARVELYELLTADHDGYLNRIKTEIKNIYKNKKSDIDSYTTGINKDHQNAPKILSDLEDEINIMVKFPLFLNQALEKQIKNALDPNDTTTYKQDDEELRGELTAIINAQLKGLVNKDRIKELQKGTKTENDKNELKMRRQHRALLQNKKNNENNLKEMPNRRRLKGNLTSSLNSKIIDGDRNFLYQQINDKNKQLKEQTDLKAKLSQPDNSLLKEVTAQAKKSVKQKELNGINDALNNPEIKELEREINGKRLS